MKTGPDVASEQNRDVTRRRDCRETASDDVSARVSAEVKPKPPLLDRLADLVRDAVASGDLALASALIEAQKRSAPATKADVIAIADERARRK